MCENQQFKVDMLPFIVEAIISNEKIKNDIDDLYEKNKYRAYELAKNNKYYDHPILCDGSIEREIYAKRTLGLLLLTDENDDAYNDMVHIIKKGWKNLYNYVKSSTSNVINLEVLNKKFYKPNYTDDETNAYFVITLLLCQLCNIKIIPENFLNKIGEMLYIRLSHYDKKDTRFNYNNIINNKLILSKATSIRNRFFETYGVINKIEDIWSIKDENLRNFSDKISMIFDSEDMMFSSMIGNVKINKKDILELAALYFLLYENQNKEESAKFIVFGLYLKYVIKSYKQVKNFYFANNKETLFIQLKNYENSIISLEDENNALKRKIKVLENELDSTRNQYKNSIEKENILLKQENNKLKLQIEDMQKNEKELKALRQVVFERKNNDILIEEVEYNQIIPSVKAVIAGGHANWHTKLKDILPNSFKYIEGDNEAFDASMLNDVEYVFIYTQYMSHAFYYKLINKCKNTNTKICYINSTSPEYVRKEIYFGISSQ